MYMISFNTVLQAINGLLHIPLMAISGFPLLLGRVQFKDINSLKLGSKVRIGNNVILGKDITIGNKVSIGLNTYIDNKVTISDRVSISRNVSLLTSTHTIDQSDRRAGEIYCVSPLEIGEGVWIGTNVTVLPQVKRIGAYSVIGAGSVVTKDVPDNVVVAGNPARVIRELEPTKLNNQS